MADDKRTQIGTAGPVRPTGAQPVASASRTPAPAKPSQPPMSAVLSVATPTTDPPVTSGSAVTSYLPPATDPLLGATLAGRYLIQKKLGEGGMGAVYLATHQLLEKQVALKVLHGEFARKPDLVERFMQEAKAASRIRHENVIDISDFGTTPEGLVFFAMELLKGHDLHEEVARARIAGRLLPWSRSKRIFLQICAALSAAHAQGIIHRDLKPENIYLIDFLGDADFVKLLDFGIAKLTETNEGDRKLTKTGMLFGTPEYMSPEQARGETVDHRVDVYAMGCILFQLVTGRVPFEADNFMGVLSLHLTEPPPTIPVEVFDSIGAPREIGAVIERALAKDRNQRFSSIDELVRAVRAASGEKITAPVAVPVAENVAAPGPTTQSRQKRTEWTGTLNVPQVDDGPATAPAKSKLPLILGAVVLVGGAAGAAAFFATRGGGGGGGASPGSGSAPVVVTAPTDAGPMTVAPDAAPVAPPVALPEWSKITLDSTPHGAKIRDLTNNTELGTTPLTFKLHGSATPRQFGLRLSGYSDAVVELVPSQEKVAYTEKLEKGAAGTTVVHKVPDLTSPPVAVPPPGPGSAAKPPDPIPEIKPPDPKPPVVETPPVVKPPDPKPPTDDDCGDPPCLKADPSRPK